MPTLRAGVIGRPGVLPPRLCWLAGWPFDCAAACSKHATVRAARLGCIVDDVAAGDFGIRPMTAADARTVASWRYPGEYSFYDADADADDLAELLNPAEWGRRYFAADDTARHELAGILVIKLSGRVAEIGLGLRPDLTGSGLGGSFVDACLRFAAAALGAESFTLAVAAFNRRAITVYERAGFREMERFEHFTNGGLHTFVRMVRGPVEKGGDE
jgi:[ribosomal protein S18]-alanine N-acetyltransferase